MGSLVNHIHNRDLASENIVAAFCRKSFVLSAPPETLTTLHARLDAAGIRLPLRSLLQATDAVVATKGALSGEFAVVVLRNKRQEMVLDLTSTPESSLTRSIQGLAQQLQLGTPVLERVVSLLGGGARVRINGRAYRQGDFIEYARQVPRTQPQNAAAAASRGVASIRGFVLVPFARGGRGGHPRTEANVLCLQVVAFQTTQDVTGVSGSSTGASVAIGGSHFSRTGVHVVHLGDDSALSEKLIHVDSVVYKLHRVPHFSDNDKFIAMRIWEAR